MAKPKYWAHPDPKVQLVLDNIDVHPDNYTWAVKMATSAQKMLILVDKRLEINFETMTVRAL